MLAILFNALVAVYDYKYREIPLWVMAGSVICTVLYFNLSIILILAAFAPLVFFPSLNRADLYYTGLYISVLYMCKINYMPMSTMGISVLAVAGSIMFSKSKDIPMVGIIAIGMLVLVIAEFIY